MVDGGAWLPVTDDAPGGALVGSSDSAERARLQPLLRLEALAHLSGAFDLAESQSIGHARRVAYLALGVARRLDLPVEIQRRALEVALLHDAGAAVQSDNWADAAAWVGDRFACSADVRHALASIHERWDGRGRPRKLAGPAIPIEARVVAAAHWANDVTEGDANPLRARASLQRISANEVDAIVGSEVAAAIGFVLRDDATWMALWSDELAAMLGEIGSGDGTPSLDNLNVMAEAVGEVVDLALRETGRSHLVASIASDMAERLGLDTEQCRAVYVAGHLLDVGQLGVSREITEKPAILTLDEMEQMRRHPGMGAQIIEGTPGLSAVARWVEWHHERPDGRGYPEMLGGDDIPLQARILSVADSYCALRVDRPHRPGVTRREALQLLRAGTGQQFDEAVVAVLRGAIDRCDPEDDAAAAGA